MAEFPRAAEICENLRYYTNANSSVGSRRCGNWFKKLFIPIMKIGPIIKQTEAIDGFRSKEIYI